MPIGIIGSLAVSTLLYTAVAAVMTGAVPYHQLNNAEPVAFVLRSLGYNFGSALVGTGAICGRPAVLLVMMYAQTRVLFTMSRDGLIPAVICKVHRKYSTPYVITIIVGAVIALVSGFTSIGVVAEMCSIGTLFAFVIAVIGLVVLRITKPDMERPFRCPSVKIVATLAILFCLYIMYNLSFATWIRFIVWSVIGMAIYYCYGYSHSILNKRLNSINMSHSSQKSL